MIFEEEKVGGVHRSRDPSLTDQILALQDQDIENPYEAEISEQFEMAKKLDDTIDERMMEQLSKFDDIHQTLIDYFVIIGAGHDQLLKLIQDLMSDVNTKGSDYQIARNSSYIDSNYNESRGRYRVLNPRVLARFPKTDRPNKNFPGLIADFFFNERETVFTYAEKEEYLASQENGPDGSYEFIETKQQLGSQIFATTHIFFEDLADV